VPYQPRAVQCSAAVMQQGLCGTMPGKVSQRMGEACTGVGVRVVLFMVDGISEHRRHATHDAFAGHATVHNPMKAAAGSHTLVHACSCRCPAGRQVEATAVNKAPMTLRSQALNISTCTPVGTHSSSNFAHSAWVVVCCMQRAAL
jgi:hypothetical protein